MKNKYLILFISLLIFLGHSCSEESVYIPDPVEENNEDDGTAIEPTTNAVLKIQPSTVYQEIDGFGCAFAEWSHRLYTNTQRSAILDELFGDNGLKLNILRNEPFPHYEAPDGSVDFGISKNFELAANDPAIINGFWNYENGAEAAKAKHLGQLWIVNEVNRRYKDIKFIFSTWSPPISMKTTGAVNNGSLRTDKYPAFADFLVNFLKAYQQRCGIKVYGISGSNEPNSTMGDWSHCIWNPDQLAKFSVENLRPTLDKAGMSDTKIIFGEHSAWGAGGDYIKDALTKNAQLAESNIIAAAHGYLSADVTIKPFQAAIDKNLKVWQTELSNTSAYDPSWDDAIKWAVTFHTYLANGRVNAFVWWAGARPVSNNESLIKLEEKVPGMSYEKPMRYYAFGQFTKYILPESHRVGIDKTTLQENTNVIPDEVLTTAYIKDDIYTAVIVNPTNKPIETRVEVVGKKIRNMRIYTSSESVQWSKKKINPAPSGARAFMIPAKGIVTVTGNLNAETPAE